MKFDLVQSMLDQKNKLRMTIKWVFRFFGVNSANSFTVHAFSSAIYPQQFDDAVFEVKLKFGKNKCRYIVADGQSVHRYW